MVLFFFLRVFFFSPFLKMSRGLEPPSYLPLESERRMNQAVCDGLSRHWASSSAWEFGQRSWPLWWLVIASVVGRDMGRACVTRRIVDLSCESVISRPSPVFSGLSPSRWGLFKQRRFRFSGSASPNGEDDATLSNRNYPISALRSSLSMLTAFYVMSLNYGNPAIHPIGNYNSATFMLWWCQCKAWMKEEGHASHLLYDTMSCH